MEYPVDLVRKLDNQINSLMPDRKRLSDNPFKYLRQMLRYTVAEMAVKIGCSEPTVKNYERGTNPTKRYLNRYRKLAKQNNCHISLEELFKYD